MTKFRIKNPEVEKAVRYLFKCNFPKNGLTAYEVKPEARLVRFYVDEKSSVSDCNLIFELHESLVEEVVEYDPKVWNPYPQVTPPKDDYYRVQMTLPNFEVKRFMLEWRDGKWRVNHLYEHRELLFKPWDDEESEE